MEAFTKPVSQQEGSTPLYICTAAHGERENVPFSCLGILGGSESIEHIDHIFFCVLTLDWHDAWVQDPRHTL